MELNRRALIIPAAVAVFAVALATGCSAQHSSSGQNAQVNSEYRNGQLVQNHSGCTNLCTGSNTVRYDTPGNFPAVVRVCEGHFEGLYVSESDTGEVNVVQNDPSCGYTGTNPGGGGYQAVPPATRKP